MLRPLGETITTARRHEVYSFSRPAPSSPIAATGLPVSPADRNAVGCRFQFRPSTGTPSARKRFAPSRGQKYQSPCTTSAGTRTSSCSRPRPGTPHSLAEHINSFAHIGKRTVDVCGDTTAPVNRGGWSAFNCTSPCPARDRNQISNSPHSHARRKTLITLCRHWPRQHQWLVPGIQQAMEIIFVPG